MASKLYFSPVSPTERIGNPAALSNVKQIDLVMNRSGMYDSTESNEMMYMSAGTHILSIGLHALIFYVAMGYGF